MILAEKIQTLRKKKGLSQEQLAEACQVSRQSISKWEADIALPETDKLLLLSEIFHVSLDVLLKDEYDVDAVKEVHTCGNIIKNKSEGRFSGILIKESISDENFLDLLEVNKVELWKTEDTPRYWTVIYFSSNCTDFPEKLSKVLITRESSGNWFCDFRAGNIKYIVFYEKVLRYEIGNVEQKDTVIQECKKQGIPDEQMNWEE